MITSGHESFTDRMKREEREHAREALEWLALLVIVFAILAICNGCAAKPICEPIIVKVPVVTPIPSPPVIERPKLPVTTLTPAATPSQAQKAWADSLAMCVATANACMTALDSYREPEPAKSAGVAP